MKRHSLRPLLISCLMVLFAGCSSPPAPAPAPIVPAGFTVTAREGSVIVFGNTGGTVNTRAGDDATSMTAAPKSEPAAAPSSAPVPSARP